MGLKEDSFNQLIKENDLDTNLISDGYHTFGELYEHRITLFIALAKRLECLPGDYIAPLHSQVWRSLKHSDGSSFEGWFVLGIGKDKGHQITYHLPINKWDECNFAKTLEVAPDFDGHNASDVLQRIKKL